MGSAEGPRWAPVCARCGSGAMLHETYAEAAQSDDGARVAVVINVPRRRCSACRHTDLDQGVAVGVGGLLGSALRRNSLTVIDWNDVGE